MRDSSHNQATTQQAYIFRSYLSGQKDAPSLARNADEYIKDVKVWEVLRATSAAPSYFKPVKIGELKYRDGAQWKSNPATEIFNEVVETYRSNSQRSIIKAFVSIGCGRGAKPAKSPVSRHKSTGSISATFPWPDTGVVERRLSRKLHEAFFNFGGPHDLFDLEANEWRTDRNGNRTFNRIRESVERYCGEKTIKTRLKEAAHVLVNLRHHRAKTTKWERFALGAKYVCRLSILNTPKWERVYALSARKQGYIDEVDTANAKPCERMFDDRGAYMDHLLSEHEIPPQDEANWDSILKLLVESMITTLT